MSLDDKVLLLLLNFSAHKHLWHRVLSDFMEGELTSAVDRLHPEKAVGVDLGVNFSVNFFEPSGAASTGRLSVPVFSAAALFLSASLPLVL